MSGVPSPSLLLLQSFQPCALLQLNKDFVCLQGKGSGILLRNFAEVVEWSQWAAEAGETSQRLPEAEGREQGNGTPPSPAPSDFMFRRV